MQEKITQKKKKNNNNNEKRNERKYPSQVNPYYQHIKVIVKA